MLYFQKASIPFYDFGIIGKLVKSSVIMQKSFYVKSRQDVPFVVFGHNFITYIMRSLYYHVTIISS